MCPCACFVCATSVLRVVETGVPFVYVLLCLVWWLVGPRRYRRNGTAGDCRSPAVPRQHGVGASGDHRSAVGRGANCVLRCCVVWYCLLVFAVLCVRLIFVLNRICCVSMCVFSVVWICSAVFGCACCCLALRWFAMFVLCCHLPRVVFGVFAMFGFVSHGCDLFRVCVRRCIVVCCFVLCCGLRLLDVLCSAV